MSFARLGLLSRPCGRATSTMGSISAARLLAVAPSSSRLFSSTPAVLLRKPPKVRPPLSKKAAAAKARRKAAKAPKHIYANEKMSLNDAISVLRAVEVARPTATYELVVRTAMPKGTAIPKGRINLPRSAKEKAKDVVLVFAEGRQAEEAKRAGADIVGGPDLIDGIINGRIHATTFLSTTSLIRQITPKLGRVLGPRGLMPSERRGTVTDDIVGYLQRLKGTDEWKGDKAGTIRTPIGKVNWPAEDVVKNVNFFLQTVKRATGNTKDAKQDKSQAARPVNAITRVLLKSSFGPSIQLNF